MLRCHASRPWSPRRSWSSGAGLALGLGAILALAPLRAAPPLPYGVMAALGRAASAAASGHSRAEANALIEAAEESANPVLAARATIVAYAHRHLKTAHTAALLWRTLAPHDPQAVSFLFLTDVALGRERQGIRRLAELLPPGAPWIEEEMLSTLLIRRLPSFLALRIAQLWAKRHPRALGPRYLLGLVALKIGMPGMALLMARDLLAAKTKLVADHRLRAQELVSQAEVYGGRTRRGLRHAEQLLRAHPQLFPLAINLMSLELISGHDHAAHTLARQWRRTESEARALFLVLALSDLHLDHPRRARRWLTRLLETAHDQSLAAFNIGRVEARLHHVRRARFWFRWAAERAERDVPASALALARLAGGGHATPAARAVFDRYASRVPLQASRVYRLEAHWLDGLGHPRAALAVLVKAHDLEPSDPDTIYALALFDMKVGKGAQGYRLLQALARRFPDNPWILNAEGYYLARHTGHLRRAAQDLTRALKLDPGDPPLVDSRGWLSYRRGHYHKALTDFRKAYAHDRSPTIAIHYGLALWKLGERAQARALWLAALKEHPHDRALARVIAGHRGS